MNPIEKLGAPYGLCRKCRHLLEKGVPICNNCKSKISKKWLNDNRRIYQR